MKKLFVALACGFLASCAPQKPSMEPAIPYDADLEKKVEATLSKMTLEEKIGQMTELTIDVLDDYSQPGFQVNEAVLDTLIGKYKVGSILNVPGAAPTREQWLEIISKIQEKSMKYLGIPCIYGLDMNHGVTYTQDGTLFPYTTLFRSSSVNIR